MKRLWFVLFVVTILVLVGYATKSAQGQSTPPPGAKVVERPELKPGSWWLYRTKTEYEFKSILKEVKPDGTLIVEELELAKPNIYTPEWNATRGIGTRRREPNDFSPHNSLFSFPLWEGKRWTFDYTLSGPVPAQVSGSSQVSLWEKVNVPGGTFLALKIVRSGTWRT